MGYRLGVTFVDELQVFTTDGSNIDLTSGVTITYNKLKSTTNTDKLEGVKFIQFFSSFSYEEYDNFSGKFTKGGRYYGFEFPLGLNNYPLYDYTFNTGGSRVTLNGYVGSRNRTFHYDWDSFEERTLICMMMVN